MSAQHTPDDERTDTNPPIAIRLGTLRERIDRIVDDEATDYDNRSELIREAARQLVTRHEVRDRLDQTDDEDVPENLDAVIERAPDTHPLRADGSGESA